MAMPRSGSPSVSPCVQPAPVERTARAPRPRHGHDACGSATITPSCRPHGHGNRRRPSTRCLPVALASKARLPKEHAWVVCGAHAPSGLCKPGSCLGWLPPHATVCALPPGLQQYPEPRPGPRRLRRSPLLPPKELPCDFRPFWMKVRSVLERVRSVLEGRAAVGEPW
jgi:hypothetical protein